jgi:hypothetical protein
MRVAAQQARMGPAAQAQVQRCSAVLSKTADPACAMLRQVRPDLIIAVQHAVKEAQHYWPGQRRPSFLKAVCSSACTPQHWTTWGTDNDIA